MLSGFGGAIGIVKQKTQGSVAYSAPGEAIGVALFRKKYGCLVATSSITSGVSIIKPPHGASETHVDENESKLF